MKVVQCHRERMFARRSCPGEPLSSTASNSESSLGHSIMLPEASIAPMISLRWLRFRTHRELRVQFCIIAAKAYTQRLGTLGLFYGMSFTSSQCRMLFWEQRHTAQPHLLQWCFKSISRPNDRWQSMQTSLPVERIQRGLARAFSAAVIL